jgi:hypothetical protein
MEAAMQPNDGVATLNHLFFTIWTITALTGC